MTTSQPTSFLSEIVSGAPIPPEKLGYFRGRLSNRFHELVLELFDELERDGKITRAALARRIGKAPEQVTRWLGAPGNWTLDTASDLFLGMGYEPTLSATEIVEQPAEAPVSFEDMFIETNAAPNNAPTYAIFDPFATQQGPRLGYWLNLNANTSSIQCSAIPNMTLLNGAQWAIPGQHAVANTTEMYFRYLAETGSVPVENEEEGQWNGFEMFGAESFLGKQLLLHNHKSQGALQ